MSGTTATGMGGAELGFRAPFTAVQWQELEQQAMVYKYLVAGLPVPPDLIMPIRRSFEAATARFFHHPALGYYSYYGKKYDPEPGRCRRTDGKKWRCSKEAHSDSKYCERHMHRGRNRSRKHVESQSTSQSSSTVRCGANARNLHGIASALYSVDNNPDGSSSRRNAAKLHIEPTSYAVEKKDNSRFFHGLSPEGDVLSFSPEASGSIGNLGLGSPVATRFWHPSSLSFRQNSDLLGAAATAQQNMPPHAFRPVDAALPKQQRQSEHLFFSEWPATKDSWSNLDAGESNQNMFSSTRLSISTPRASTDFPPTTSYTTNDASRLAK